MIHVLPVSGNGTPHLIARNVVDEDAVHDCQITAQVANRAATGATVAVECTAHDDGVATVGIDRAATNVTTSVSGMVVIEGSANDL